MEQLFTVDVLRMFERQMVVLGGILAIILGYRLFRLADLKQDSTGSVKTKVFEITATKIGPGVFFAAFGTAVLWSSLTHWFNPYAGDTQAQATIARPAVNQQELAQLQNIAERETRAEDRQLLQELIKRIKLSDK